MATRRARLQIKPNIAGPPAVKPVKKPAPKPATRPTASKETVQESTVKEKSDEQHTEQSTSLTEKEHIASPKKDVTDDKPGITPKSPDTQTSNKDMSNEKETSDSLQSPPKRARLRRFGQVNLSSIKGSPKSGGTKDKGEEASNTVTDHPVPAISAASTEEKSQGDGSGETKTDAKENKPIVRRSRFPKAKPNVIDAGKKRQRPAQQQQPDSDRNEKKENESNSSTSEPATKTIPEIVVHPPDKISPLEPTDTSSSASSIVPIVKSDGSQMTHLHSRPLVQRSPIKTPVSPAILASSPVKQPHATDKRQRTVSISEPPVIKRAKKIKVDAPTDKPPDRSTMRMRDLIHWNPQNNPMKPKVKTPGAGGAEIVIEKEKENIAKDRVPPVAPVEPEISEDSNSSMPVPQLTIGPDGNIVINEKSLVVNNPDDDKGSGEDNVIDETDMVTTYGSFKKITKSKRWTNKETAKFYKALGMIGIDFFMIQKLFPKRTRFDIKKKFKNEERKNKPLIDKILNEDIHFDPAVFDAPQDDPSSDEEDRKKKTEPKKRGRKKKVVERKEPDEKKDVEKPKIKPTKSKPARRKVIPLNYFEDSYDELESEKEEESTSAKTDRSADKVWQSPEANENDDEVVDILVDMSSGRLPSEGNQTNINIVQSGMTLPSITQNTVLPGIQNIMTIKTQPMFQEGYNGSAQSFSPASLNSSVSAVENTESTRVVLNSPSHSPLAETQKPFTAERLISSPKQTYIQPGTSPCRPSEQTLSIVNQSTEQPIESQSTLITNGNIPEGVLGTLANMPQGQEEQYVLVTVMPEGGEETMIHIYRLHDAALTQGPDTDRELNVVSGGAVPDVENL